MTLDADTDQMAWFRDMSDLDRQSESNGRQKNVFRSSRSLMHAVRFGAQAFKRSGVCSGKGRAETDRAKMGAWFKKLPRPGTSPRAGVPSVSCREGRPA